jgi:uncharacterized membrane protein YkvA (DUF1232 family)
MIPSPLVPAPATASPALTLLHTLSSDLPPDALRALLDEVRSHYASLSRTQQRSELVAIDLAELLCARLETLLDIAPKLAPDARAAIVGAARYFISTEDAVPDDQSCTGLDDDVEVFNHVARQLGRPELVIEE